MPQQEPTLEEIRDYIDELKKHPSYKCVDMAWCTEDCKQCAKDTINSLVKEHNLEATHD